VGEFGERCGESVLGFGVGSEFVGAAADVLDQGVAGGDGLGGAQAFEPAHRPQPGFQPAAIGLDAVVLPPCVDVAGRRQQFLQDPRVDGCFVGGDLDRSAAVGERGGEEPACRRLVAPLAGEDVDDLTMLVNGSV